MTKHPRAHAIWRRGCVVKAVCNPHLSWKVYWLNHSFERKPTPLCQTGFVYTVCLCLQEGQWNPLHCHQVLSGHHDHLWVLGLLPVPPAALLPAWKNGERNNQQDGDRSDFFVTISGENAVVSYSWILDVSLAEMLDNDGSDFPQTERMHQHAEGIRSSRPSELD